MYVFADNLFAQYNFKLFIDLYQLNQQNSVNNKINMCDRLNSYHHCLLLLETKKKKKNE